MENCQFLRKMDSFQDSIQAYASYEHNERWQLVSIADCCNYNYSFGMPQAAARGQMYLLYGNLNYMVKNGLSFLFIIHYNSALYSSADNVVEYR